MNTVSFICLGPWLHHTGCTWIIPASHFRVSVMVQVLSAAAALLVITTGRADRLATTRRLQSNVRVEALSGSCCIDLVPAHREFAL